MWPPGLQPLVAFSQGRVMGTWTGTRVGRWWHPLVAGQRRGPLPRRARVPLRLDATRHRLIPRVDLPVPARHMRCPSTATAGDGAWTVPCRSIHRRSLLAIAS